MVDSWQFILIVMLIMMLLNYLLLKFFIKNYMPSEADEDEAFETREGFSGGPAESTDIQEFGNMNLYDKFYSKIYDQIVQGDVRVKSEVIFTLSWFKKYMPEQNKIEILDIGCGTGHHVSEFKKEKVRRVVGIDVAPAMIERANKLHPGNEFKLVNVEQPRTFAAGEFNLATMYYFTIYYLHHKDQILKNIFNWLRPGGAFVVHFVNRDKFDPILESASPFTAFSVQKYSKDRVTKSSVTFDKFEYTAEFKNNENTSEFLETFKFKDGKIRKNTHNLHMPVMEKLTKEIEAAGFTYKEFIDLTPVGYEYQYLFCFLR
jgi:SAM-dependent methyltransferase